MPSGRDEGTWDKLIGKYRLAQFVLSRERTLHFLVHVYFMDFKYHLKTHLLLVVDCMGQALCLQVIPSVMKCLSLIMVLSESNAECSEY